MAWDGYKYFLWITEGMSDGTLHECKFCGYTIKSPSSYYASNPPDTEGKMMAHLIEFHKAELIKEKP